MSTTVKQSPNSEAQALSSRYDVIIIGGGTDRVVGLDLASETKTVITNVNPRAKAKPDWA